MTKVSIFLAHTLLGGALILTTATASYALEGGRFSKEATITLDQARDAAMKAKPGKILDQELEYRKGGSGLRHSFDIKAGTVTREIGIDAKTESILQNSAECNKGCPVEGSKSWQP